MRFGAARDTIFGSMRMLADKKDEAFELLRLAVEQPRFDAAPIDRIRAQMVSGIVANAARSRDGGAGEMGGGALRHPSLRAAR